MSENKWDPIFVQHGVKTTIDGREWKIIPPDFGHDLQPTTVSTACCCGKEAYEFVYRAEDDTVICLGMKTRVGGCGRTIKIPKEVLEKALTFVWRPAKSIRY